MNFHAITMDRFFLMIAVSPIKSCFEIRSTLANFERSKSPEYFHTIIRVSFFNFSVKFQGWQASFIESSRASRKKVKF